MIDDVLDYLQAHVDADVGEEFQPIDLGPFETDLRQKAIEAGLKRDYDLVFAHACAEVHGEWASLDRFYLVRCANPLHRGHRVANLNPTRYLALGAVDMVIRYAFEMTQACARLLEGAGSTDDDAGS